MEKVFTRITQTLPVYLMMTREVFQYFCCLGWTASSDRSAAVISFLSFSSYLLNHPTSPKLRVMNCCPHILLWDYFTQCWIPSSIARVRKSRTDPNHDATAAMLHNYQIWLTASDPKRYDGVSQNILWLCATASVHLWYTVYASLRMNWSSVRQRRIIFNCESGKAALIKSPGLQYTPRCSAGFKLHASLVHIYVCLVIWDVFYSVVLDEASSWNVLVT